MATPRIFLCYAREDSDFCDRLSAALQGQGIDLAWDRALSPALDYLDQIRSLIRSADAFAIVLSSHSTSSLECQAELQYAIETGKRLVPILRDPAVAADRLPEPIRRLQWCLCTPADPLEAGTAQIFSALQTNADLVPTHTRLLSRIEEWEARGRSRGSLLTDERQLSDAEAWLVRATDSTGLPEPTALQREYLLLSRREATANSRRYRATATSIIVVLAVAVAVAWWFRNQSARNATEAIKNASDARTSRDQAVASAKIADEKSRNLLQEQGRQDLLSGRWDAAAIRLAEAYRMGSDSPALRLMLGAAMIHLSGVKSVLPNGAAAIVATQFSDDGRRIFVTGSDRNIRVWDSGTGRLEAVLGPYELVEDVYLNSDGSRALVMSGVMGIERAETNHRTYQPAAELWDVAQQKVLRDWSFGSEFFEPQRIPRAEIAGSGEHFLFRDLEDEAFAFRDGGSVPRAAASAGRPAQARAGASLVSEVYQNAVIVANRGSRRKLLLADESMPHAMIAFAGDSADLTMVSTSGILRRIGASGTRLGADRTVGGPVFALSSDGRWAAGRRESLGVVLDLASLPKGLAEATVEEDRFIDGRFSLNGRFLVTRRTEGRLAVTTTFTVFDSAHAHSNRNLVAGSGVAYGDFELLAISSTGTDYTASNMLMTQFWTTGSRAATEAPRKEAMPVAAEFSPDGQVLIIGMDSGSVVVRETRSLRTINETHDVPGRQLDSHRGDVLALAFDARSRLLATAGADRTAKIWDLTTGALISTCEGHTAAVNSVQFSRDGTLLATASDDRTARVWDLPSCVELLSFPQHSGPVRTAIFDARGSRLATSDDFAVRLWDLPRETRSAADVADGLAGLSLVCLSAGKIGRWSVPARGAAHGSCEVY